jgi:hypothetical protein
MTCVGFVQRLSESRMLETGMSGLMSGEGKRMAPPHRALPRLYPARSFYSHSPRKDLETHGV